MKSRVARIEENGKTEQKICFSSVRKSFSGGNSRSFRVSAMVRKTLVVGLLGGNSRSFTLKFVAGFSVLLFCFDGWTVKHSVTQRVSYSCSLVRYLRARVTSVQNLPDFWRLKNHFCHFFNIKLSKVSNWGFWYFGVKILQYKKKVLILHAIRF